MKKSVKKVKLALQTETVRNLSSNELLTVAGAGVTAECGGSMQTLIVSKCTASGTTTNM